MVFWVPPFRNAPVEGWSLKVKERCWVQTHNWSRNKCWIKFVVANGFGKFTFLIKMNCTSETGLAIHQLSCGGGTKRKTAPAWLWILLRENKDECDVLQKETHTMEWHCANKSYDHFSASAICVRSRGESKLTLCYDFPIEIQRHGCFHNGQCCWLPPPPPRTVQSYHFPNSNWEHSKKERGWSGSINSMQWEMITCVYTNTTLNKGV